MPGFISLLFALFLLQGCDGSVMPMKMQNYNVDSLNNAFKRDKNIFDGKTIVNAKLSGDDIKGKFGVEIEDIIIRNLTMNNVQMWRAHLKNITFVDCTFIKVDFTYSKFENVKFIRCSISGYKKPIDSYDAYRTDFSGIIIDRILFEDVSIGRSVYMNFHDGIVVMKNVTVTSKEKQTANLLSGSNLHVRIDNCVVENQHGLGIIEENSSAYITNSRFINADLEISGKAAWMENCTLNNSTAPESEVVVIKNCRLDAVGIDIGKDGQRNFLVNNTYTNSTGTVTLWLFRAQHDTIKDNSHLYLYGPTNIPGTVYVDSGNVNIYEVEIGRLVMRQQSSNRRMANLNLQNVKIGKGKWTLADVQHGKWEHVQLGAPIDLDEAKIGTITGHYVEFTNGYPWVNGKLDIVDSSQPLEFDKPPVPTLEELGLAQFWKENDFPVEKY
jgi:uncharacterized protein YjbI with pentapeptide repeats